MRQLVSSITVLVLLTIAACNAPGENALKSSAADAIYFNGDIITMEGDSVIYTEAVAVKGDKIIFVGNKADAEKMKIDSTVMYNLQGKTMLPGFIDPIIHAYIEATILSNTLHKCGITTACEQVFSDVDIDLEKKSYTLEINKPTTHYRLLMAPNAMNLYSKLNSADQVFIYCDSLIKTGTPKLNYIKIANAYINGAVFIELNNTYYQQQQDILNTFLNAGWDMHVCAKDNANLNWLLSVIKESKLQTSGYTSQIILEYSDAFNAARHKEITDANITICYSDYSIMPSPPLQYVCTVINKTNMPQPNINLWAAIKKVTIEAARSIRKENEIGSITVGKKADFVLLAENPFKIDPARIKDIKIVETVFEGKSFHEN